MTPNSSDQGNDGGGHEDGDHARATRPAEHHRHEVTSRRGTALQQQTPRAEPERYGSPAATTPSTVPEVATPEPLRVTARQLTGQRRTATATSAAATAAADEGAAMVGRTATRRTPGVLRQPGLAVSGRTERTTTLVLSSPLETPGGGQLFSLADGLQIRLPPFGANDQGDGQEDGDGDGGDGDGGEDSEQLYREGLRSMLSPYQPPPQGRAQEEAHHHHNHHHQNDNDSTISALTSRGATPPKALSHRSSERAARAAASAAKAAEWEQQQARERRRESSGGGSGRRMGHAHAQQQQQSSSSSSRGKPPVAPGGARAPVPAPAAASLAPAALAATAPVLPAGGTTAARLTPSASPAPEGGSPSPMPRDPASEAAAAIAAAAALSTDPQALLRFLETLMRDSGRFPATPEVAENGAGDAGPSGTAAASAASAAGEGSGTCWSDGSLTPSLTPAGSADLGRSNVAAVTGAGCNAGADAGAATAAAAASGGGGGGGDGATRTVGSGSGASGPPLGTATPARRISAMAEASRSLSRSALVAAGLDDSAADHSLAGGGLEGQDAMPLGRLKDHLPCDLYERWTDLLLNHSSSDPDESRDRSADGSGNALSAEAEAAATAAGLAAVQAAQELRLVLSPQPATAAAAVAASSSLAASASSLAAAASGPEAQPTSVRVPHRRLLLHELATAASLVGHAEARRSALEREARRLRASLGESQAAQLELTAEVARLQATAACDRGVVDSTRELAKDAKDTAARAAEAIDKLRASAQAGGARAAAFSEGPSSSGGGAEEPSSDRGEEPPSSLALTWLGDPSAGSAYATSGSPDGFLDGSSYGAANLSGSHSPRQGSATAASSLFAVRIIADDDSCGSDSDGNSSIPSDSGLLCEEADRSMTASDLAVASAHRRARNLQRGRGGGGGRGGEGGGGGSSDEGGCDNHGSRRGAFSAARLASGPEASLSPRRPPMGPAEWAALSEAMDGPLRSARKHSLAGLVHGAPSPKSSLLAAQPSPSPATAASTAAAAGADAEAAAGATANRFLAAVSGSLARAREHTSALDVYTAARAASGPLEVSIYVTDSEWDNLEADAAGATSLAGLPLAPGVSFAPQRAASSLAAASPAGSPAHLFGGGLGGGEDDDSVEVGDRPSLAAAADLAAAAVRAMSPLAPPVPVPQAQAQARSRGEAVQVVASAEAFLSTVGRPLISDQQVAKEKEQRAGRCVDPRVDRTQGGSSSDGGISGYDDDSVDGEESAASLPGAAHALLRAPSIGVPVTPTAVPLRDPRHPDAGLAVPTSPALAAASISSSSSSSVRSFGGGSSVAMNLLAATSVRVLEMAKQGSLTSSEAEAAHAADVLAAFRAELDGALAMRDRATSALEAAREERARLGRSLASARQSAAQDADRASSAEREAADLKAELGACREALEARAGEVAGLEAAASKAAASAASSAEELAACKEALARATAGRVSAEDEAESLKAALAATKAAARDAADGAAAQHAAVLASTVAAEVARSVAAAEAEAAATAQLELAKAAALREGDAREADERLTTAVREAANAAREAAAASGRAELEIAVAEAAAGAAAAEEAAAAREAALRAEVAGLRQELAAAGEAESKLRAAQQAQAVAHLAQV